MLLGLCIIVAAALLRGADPWPLEVSRLKVFDLYQQLRPRIYQPAPVRVIDIDEASLARIGQWPWPRKVVADLVNRLSAAGAAVIAFDLVFSEPDRTSPRQLMTILPDSPDLVELRTRLASLPDHDDMLAKALSATASVGGFFVIRGERSLSDGCSRVTSRPPPVPRKSGFAYGGSDPLKVLQCYDDVAPNLPVFEDAFTGHGVLSLAPELDNVVRRVPLIVALEGEIYPSLPVETLRVAFGASTLISRSIDASGEVGAGETGLADLRIGPLTVPMTRRGEIWVRYGEFVPERTLSAVRALEAPGADLAPLLEGAIVLIGTSASGLRDLNATPLRPTEPGVLIHAQIIEQILFNDHLMRPDWTRGAELLALIFAGGLVVVSLPLVGALWGATIGFAAAGSAAAVSWFAFANAGLLLDPLAPILTVIAAYICVTTAQYFLTERERTGIRTAFGQYLAPALVEQIARDPKKLKLNGEVRELTLLFLDLRGFTALSERLSPDKVVQFLNRFLTPMTEVVMDSGGTVDKYMGDALMAFWNAPIDQPDHAARACRAALEIRRRFALLKDRLGLSESAIGVGLNCGPTNVGNMGSVQRFAYSAIGDAVNTASRLEGLSKIYGIDIIASDEMRLAAPDFAWLAIDRVKLVGRQEPVTIHTLLGTGSAELSQAHQAALDLYRNRNWPAARERFAAAAHVAPAWLQPVYAVFVARITGFETTPPDADWEGVFVAETK